MSSTRCSDFFDFAGLTDSVEILENSFALAGVESLDPPGGREERMRKMKRTESVWSRVAFFPPLFRFSYEMVLIEPV